jgi:hypothetical protein
LASLGPIVCADATAGRGFLDRETANADQRGAARFPTWLQSFRNDCDLTEVRSPGRRLRDRDSNPNFLIQSQASYH